MRMEKEIILEACIGTVKIKHPCLNPKCLKLGVCLRKREVDCAKVKQTFDNIMSALNEGPRQTASSSYGWLYINRFLPKLVAYKLFPTESHGDPVGRQAYITKPSPGFDEGYRLRL